MIVAVASQKGGTGKTTTALQLAAALGKGALLVDLDPQGACSISLGLDADSLDATVYDVMRERAIVFDVIQPSNFGFDLLPANVDLAAAELELVNQPRREDVLKRALAPVASDYHSIIIDTPPTLGLLTMNAFAAADSVLIPVSTQLLSLRGLTTLLDTISRVRHYGVNPTLWVLGILPTKFDARTVHARQVVEHLRVFAAEQAIPLFEPVAATVRFDEATNEHVPFVVLFPDHQATRVYRKVAHAIAP